MRPTTHRHARAQGSRRGPPEISSPAAARTARSREFARLVTGLAGVAAVFLCNSCVGSNTGGEPASSRCTLAQTDDSAASRARGQLLDASAVNVTAYGAVGDGVTDDTFAFRAALSSGETVVVPRPPAYYRITGTLDVKASLLGVDSPRICLEKPDGTPSRVLIQVKGYAGKQLTVSGLQLDGGWDGKDAPGEWSHGVSITGSEHVIVENCAIANTWGDSVYVGASGGRESADITIRNNSLRDPRRCNVAVVAGRRVQIERNAIAKSNAYVSAVDVEPNNDNGTTVEGVRISLNTIASGKSCAINLYSPPPSTGYQRTVRDVTIERNTISGRCGVFKSAHTGAFDGITVKNNDYKGPWKQFAIIERGIGVATNRVIVEGNTTQ